MSWHLLFGEVQDWELVLRSLGLLAGATLTGLLLFWGLFRVLGRFAQRTDTALDNILVRRWRGPTRLLLPLLLILVVSPSLTFPDGALQIFRHIFSLFFIAAVTWLLANSTFALRDIILARYDLAAKDNLKARVMHTQVNVLVKILLVIVFVIALATMLMTFEKIRQVGVSLLASAGIVGVIAGFAAQRSLATIFAGIQIAVTQPIRLDDVVIVEGEWGRIEEITLTYVVVRIWDQRRLIVPITYFLEKPFQNWTRVSAELTGSIFLYTDYSVPIEALRQELHGILQQSPLWDGRVENLAVTNTSERAMELRVLVSAEDSSKAWDLRCEVREKLLDFLQRHYPHSLPRVRAEVAAGSAQTEQPEFQP